ncbi:MAG: cbb3-type cytochrome c oxidase subunit I [Rickettsiaceae bacterium]|nr:cbb3-type cytochrome c oxidase subunit I [Rickettsiaceae bacterium]
MIIRNKLAISWLRNAVTALAISGLYSIIIVILRTPKITDLFTDKDIFKSALIIHVNLSVLVWLLSIMAVIWSYSNIKVAYLRVFSRLSFVSMVLMMISPFVGEKIPVMNNYIPMLENLSFIIGLSLFGVSIFCFAVVTAFTSYIELSTNNHSRTLNLVKFTSAIMIIAVWLCFILSLNQLDKLTEVVDLDIDYYYEMLYWSGGHLLQFIYTQILMLVLLILFEIALSQKLKLNSLYNNLFISNFLLSLLVFYGHFTYDIADGEFKEFYTLHMKYTGGLVPSLFILALAYEMFILTKSKIKNDKLTSLVNIVIFSSCLLFLSGGLIGLIIAGINVTIPAHYHGSIVGISIAFMGFTYIHCYQQQISPHITDPSMVSNLLILNNSTEKSNSNDLYTTKKFKLPIWQIYILTFGQILHISGLALAGGYGILRKDPDGNIMLSAKIYMGLVGAGGLIAIIGGLIFVYICGKKLYFYK